MHEIEIGLLKDLVVVFGCAAPVVYLFHRLKQSPIVGFVVTGAIVGPYGLHLVSDGDSVRTLATVGVMILLFSLGLEFSLKKLMETRVAVLVAGPLQLGGTIAIVILITQFFEIPINSGLIYGMLIGLSSTAVFMKMLAERGEADAIHGRLGLGIAIFQDLCTIPFLIAIPLMADRNADSLSVVSALGKSVALIGLVLIAARYLFPVLLRGILKTSNKELFLITSIFMFLGTAWATANAGVSLGLGSFLAGLILSESESGPLVGLFQPGDQLGVYFGGAGEPYPVADHCIEASGFLEPLGRSNVFQVDTDIHPGFGGRLDEPELLVAAQADIGFFRRNLDVLAE